ncbi:hypothetical protein PLESTB_001732200 [Pleodorina starrii]|uniref:Uncharacterized protein n=1 Tax=Pleodorina starrii TaxID=330485 RepID=A0A9W6BZY0_9CHLO|nr:hypothetical protein PLESTB_001732200 [Pleodorina starrii]GLC76880.1 hypothetical protein PLESTF_001851000 [Pleodorina starrii]
MPPSDHLRKVRHQANRALRTVAAAGSDEDSYKAAASVALAWVAAALGSSSSDELMQTRPQTLASVVGNVKARRVLPASRLKPVTPRSPRACRTVRSTNIL